MAKHVLQEEFNGLRFPAREISDTSQDYMTGLQADLDAKKDKCFRRLDEVRKAVQDEMWAQNGAEISIKFVEAETACDRAGESPMCSKHDQVKWLIQEASASLVGWKAWIPREQVAHLKSKVVTLTSVSNNLKARMAEFLLAQTITVVEIREEPQPAVVPQAVVLQPGERLHPTALPKFTGSNNFYSWWKDWESLQRQGEPSGLPEIKKFQLLKSVDETIYAAVIIQQHMTFLDF